MQHPSRRRFLAALAVSVLAACTSAHSPQQTKKRMVLVPPKTGKPRAGALPTSV